MVTNISERDLVGMLDQQFTTEATVIAKQLLTDRSRRALAKPSYENLTDLIVTLRARQQNAQAHGVIAYGVDALLAALESKSRREQKILGQAYVSDRLFGKFYFDGQEGKLIGFTIIDQRQNTQKNLRPHHA